MPARGLMWTSEFILNLMETVTGLTLRRVTLAGVWRMDWIGGKELGGRVLAPLFTTNLGQ